MTWALAATVMSGALLAVSRDTGRFGWLVLIAPVPLMIWALRERSRWRVLALAWLCGVMGEAGPMWFYSRTIPLIYLFALAQGAMFALAILFLRALYARVSPAVALLGYATMSTAIEYLFSLGSPNGSFGALGYALVDVPPLLQSARAAGVAGLTFLAALIPAGVTALVASRRNMAAMLTWSVPVMVAVAYGVWQLAQPLGPAVRIALLSDDRQAGRMSITARGDTQAGDEVRAVFTQLITQASALEPAVIIVPEKILGDTTQLRAPSGSVVVAGLDVPAANSGRLNLARVYRTDAPPQTYRKKRMVPGLEREYLPGSDALITSIDGHTMGVAICKDMDFAPDLRRYGQEQVALMLVPAWDFERDRYLHSRMAVVRGVENGFSVARSASEGLMTLSDAHGRIIAEAPSARAPRMLVGDLPTGRGGTWYSRHGDTFAQLCVVMWVGLMGTLVYRRRAR